jgi:nucleoside-diphosphate-sugar epimerase
LQALRKEPMTVYGDGKQTRSFQYVSDLVSLGYSATFFAALGKERAFFLHGF